MNYVELVLEIKRLQDIPAMERSKPENDRITEINLILLRMDSYLERTHTPKGNYKHNLSPSINSFDLLTIIACITMALSFGIIAYKAFTSGAETEITAGYSFLFLIHIAALVFIWPKKKER